MAWSPRPGYRQRRSDSPHRRTLSASLWDNPSGRIGCVLVTIVVLGAVSARRWATPYPPNPKPVATLKAPSFSPPARDRPVRPGHVLARPPGPLLCRSRSPAWPSRSPGVIGTVAGIVAGYLGVGSRPP